MAVFGITLGLPVPLPLLARTVAAGFPSPADDFIEEEIDLQRLLPGRAGFATQRGRSTKFEMRSPRYTTRVDELPVVRAA